MAPRKRKNTAAAPASAVTIIAQGSRLEGTLSLHGGVHVDGDFRGEVLFAAQACVGTTGRFYGNIQAREVLVAGAFEGRIDCERLEITDSGLVVGEVVCDELVIEGGGRFGGSRRERDTPLPEPGEAACAGILPAPPLDASQPNKAGTEEVA